MNNNPYSTVNNVFFVLGTGRSGSTLLRSLLDGHPELVVWPFEFNFYTLIEDQWKNIGVHEELEFDALMNCFSGELDKFTDIYSGDLGQHRYQLKGFNAESFFGYLNEAIGTYCTRAEFLRMLLSAFHRACDRLKHSEPPKAFVVVHNQPASAILDDFSGRNLIALIRDPLETYFSNKAFYFKASENTGRDKSSVFRPYAANSRFRSLIETSISPIVHTYNWFGNKLTEQNSYIIYLEDLRSDPQTVMFGLCNFLGIDFHENMLTTTFMGQIHHSNLSSGRETKGKILSVDKNFKKDFFPQSFEDYWMCKILHSVYDGAPTLLARYPRCNLPSNINLMAFLKPMENEFPSKDGGQLKRRKLALFILIRFIRYLNSIIGYLVNRYVFLTSDYRHIIKTWPMSK